MALFILRHIWRECVREFKHQRKIMQLPHMQQNAGDLGDNGTVEHWKLKQENSSGVCVLTHPWGGNGPRVLFGQKGVEIDPYK